MLPLLLLAGTSITTLLVYVLIAVIVLSVIYWLITKFAPEPIRGYAVAVVVVIAVIILIGFLLSFAGKGGFRLG